MSYKKTTLNYKIDDQDHFLNLFTHVNRHLTICERAYDQGFTTEEINSENNSRQPQNIRLEPFQDYLKRSLPHPQPIPTREIGEICSICTYPYLPDQTYYPLKCCHNFHQSCLDKWFSTHKYSLLICPICRHDYSPNNFNQKC